MPVSSYLSLLRTSLADKICVAKNKTLTSSGWYHSMWSSLACVPSLSTKPFVVPGIQPVCPRRRESGLVQRPVSVQVRCRVRSSLELLERLNGDLFSRARTPLFPQARIACNRFRTTVCVASCSVNLAAHCCSSSATGSDSRPGQMRES